MQVTKSIHQKATDVLNAFEAFGGRGSKADVLAKADTYLAAINAQTAIAVELKDEDLRFIINGSDALFNQKQAIRYFVSYPNAITRARLEVMLDEWLRISAI